MSAVRVAGRRATRRIVSAAICGILATTGFGAAIATPAGAVQAPPAPASTSTGEADARRAEAFRNLQDRAAASAAAPASAEMTAAADGGGADSTGDVPYCQGDITAFSLIYETLISVGHTTACSSNPTSDASWVTGDTHIIWSIDSTGDSVADYSVFFFNTGAGVVSEVYYTAGSNFVKTCNASPLWNGTNLFGAQFGPSCVGAPPSVRVQAYMVWDENPFGATCSCPEDVAPNDFGFSGPIAQTRPCLASSATTGSNTVPSGGTQFAALSPTRIYDTRTGLGANGNVAKLGPGQTSTVRVTGVGGVPSSGVAAVVVNVTATAGTAFSYLSVTPSGGNTTSSLNFGPNQDVPNLVTVPVSSDGNIRVFNSAGCVDVIFDVFGYYAAAGSRFNAVDPARVLDTRIGTGRGGSTAPLAPGETRTLSIADRGGVPASGATAVVLNVTATNGSSASYLSVTPSGGSSTSNLNVAPNIDRPNLVTVPIAADGSIRIYNSQGSVHVVADVMGWYGATGAMFTPVAPSRVLDTRNGTGGIVGPLQPQQTIAARVTGVGGVPSSGVTAVLLNATATAATAPTYLSVTPEGGNSTSNLNVYANEDIANLVIVKVGSDGQNVRVFNSAGQTQVLFDVAGWFG